MTKASSPANVALRGNGAMVGARVIDVYAKMAKERQVASGGDRKSGKSVVEKLPQPIPDSGKARDQAGLHDHQFPPLTTLVLAIRPNGGGSNGLPRMAERITTLVGAQTPESADQRIVVVSPYRGRRATTIHTTISPRNH
jgi:hypothetical protein